MGVNRIGLDGNGIEYDKSSLVISPQGDVIDPCISSDELDVYQVNIDEVLSYRTQFPPLKIKVFPLQRFFDSL